MHPVRLGREGNIVEIDKSLFKEASTTKGELLSNSGCLVFETGKRGVATLLQSLKGQPIPS